MKTVTIIDYGMSNLRSVSKALEYVAERDWCVVVSNQAEAILHADKIVFPGQGAIGQCMTLLHQTGLAPLIKQALETKPFLGICLGLQSLLTLSEENGGTAGFNVITGTVRRFNEIDRHSGERLKIPHMGWNQVLPTQAHPLWNGISQENWFYFVHSYYVDPEDVNVVAGATTYGSHGFTSVIAKNNIFAVQFHPEKSQQAGLKLLRNFLDW